MEKSIPEVPTINLQHYVQVLLRHKFTLFFSILIPAVLTYAYNAQLDPVYRASTKLIIDRENVKSPLTGQRSDVESYMSESLTFNTHFELITSRPIIERTIMNLPEEITSPLKELYGVLDKSLVRRYLERVIANFKLLLTGEKETQKHVDELTKKIEVLIDLVNVETIEDTRLLILNVEYTDPASARAIADELAAAYINFNIDNRLQASENTLTWLTDNMYEVKKKLEDSESDFSDFKQEARLISVDNEQEMIAEKIREFNGAYIETRNKRLELDAKLKQLAQLAKRGGKSVTPLRSLIDNPLIDTLHADLVNAEVELSKVSKIYRKKHPKYVQVQTKIEDTRKKLSEEIKKEITNLKAERSVLITKENVIQNTVGELEKEAMDVGRKELDHDILKRNVAMNQQLYDTILSRLKEVDITGNLDVSNIRVVEAAALPQLPIGPKKIRNVILAGFLGLFLGIGICFLLEYSDRSLRTEDDVEQHLGLPVLALIPMADRKKLTAHERSRSDSEKR